MMADLALRGGKVFGPKGFKRADVLIQDGRVIAVEKELPAKQELDARGCLVAPGLVDLHTHLREPGSEEAETIESGSKAAVLGGYTAVIAMPNTNPAIDSPAMVHEINALAKNALCEIHPSGAITAGRMGERLAPIKEMADLGVKLFTDDGRGVQEDGIMRRALEYSSDLQVRLAQHCEVESLAESGQMNEGKCSVKLGLTGIPAEAEEMMVARDIALSRLTGSPVHFQHLSTKGSIDLVRTARMQGINVTCEAAPHHFTLTEELLESYDPVYKVNPPLRTHQDRDAVKEGFQQKVIDAIATDHAPHAAHKKELPFEQAPPGMLGLETALALALSQLSITPEEVIELMSINPARIGGLSHQGEPIEAGRQANICVFDSTESWVVDAQKSASLSRNNPYDKMKLTGRVRHTIFHGEPVVIDALLMR